MANVKRVAGTILLCIPVIVVVYVSGVVILISELGMGIRYTGKGPAWLRVLVGLTFLIAITVFGFWLRRQPTSARRDESSDAPGR